MTGRLLRITRPWLAGWLAAAVLAGCVRPGGRVAQGNHEQVLFWGNGGDPAGLDPQIVIGEPESHIFNALFEGLVSQDPRDLHPIPGVAESCKTKGTGIFTRAQVARFADAKGSLSASHASPNKANALRPARPTGKPRAPASARWFSGCPWERWKIALFSPPWSLFQQALDLLEREGFEQRFVLCAPDEGRVCPWKGKAFSLREMPRQIRKLIADLENAGFALVSGGKGSHRKFRHPRFQGAVILSGNERDDAHHYQEQQVRQAIREVSR